MSKPIEAGCKAIIVNTRQAKNYFLVGTSCNVLFYVKTGESFTCPYSKQVIHYIGVEAWVVDIIDTETSTSRMLRSSNLLRIDGEDFSEEAEQNEELLFEMESQQ